MPGDGCRSSCHIVNQPRIDDINCRTRLTAMQLAAMLSPSPSFILFGVVFCFIWVAAVPASTIATTLLVGVAALVGLKALLFGSMLAFNPWRVHFENDRVEFHQGKRLVFAAQLSIDDTESIAIVENRLVPRMLRLTKSDGTFFDTLYGVSRHDLESVVEQIRARTKSCESN